MSTTKSKNQYQEALERIRGMKQPTITMSEAYANLLAVLEQASAPAPANLLMALKQLPEQTSLPPLERTWRLIKFVVGEERRSWGEETLGCILADDCIRNAVEKRKQVQGRVPGEPDWKFEIDGGTEITGILRHHTTGEVIEVLIPGESEDDEENCSSIQPGSLAWQLKAMELCGAVDCVEEEDPTAVRLARRLHRRTEPILTFYRRWQDEGQRLWLAALLGDWLSAHAAALLQGHKSLIAETERRAKKWLAQQHPLDMYSFLREWSWWDCRWAVRTLTDHRVRYLHDIMKATFGYNPECVPDALGMILEEDLPDWEGEVRRWFLASRDGVRQDWEANAAVYLAKRSLCVPQVIETLVSRTCSGPDHWDLYSALVATRCDARIGRRLFRQALGSHSDQTVMLALAALAVSDWSWADGLLKKASRDMESPLTQAACRLALARRNVAKQGSNGPRGHKGAAPSLLLVNRGRKWLPLYYFGTVEELFEDIASEVLQCQADLGRRTGISRE